MKNKLQKLKALITGVVMTVSAIPISSGVFAADEAYLVRDPFYNYGSGYNYYESEHFQFIWGNSGDSSQVTQEFLEGNAKNLEACWDVYMEELEMAPPSQSVNLSLRDGNEYKTNIYISGTGLANMTDDWAYMSYDSGGFAYMFCCVGAMQYEPPSWVMPHEFGHVVTAHQLGWNQNKYSYAWWESMGNWFREQYLYSDYSTDETGHGTDFFETYLKNMNFTFPMGRDYYAAWPFLQYLTENPDNMDGYGSSFVKTMLQEGQVDEYPFDMVERLAPADLKDTLGNFAKHMAGLDFKNGDAYRARLNELLAQGSWNWQQIYTMLEPVAGANGYYTVPTERAPQAAGINIIPLEITGDKISVTLYGHTEALKSASSMDNWRACVVQQLSDGSCVYSDLFANGETMTVDAVSGVQSAYLSVAATPDKDTYVKVGLPYGPDSEFAESNYPYTEKEQYPYSVSIEGADIKKREVSTGNNWWETYSQHSNGGGLVSSNATVDASVYVAPDAMVLGSAKVTGNVRIEDHAVVQDSATVSDNAVIAGYAIVAENAVVSGNARVDDCALVMGKATVSGNARVIESACVYGEYSMTDNACAKGIAFCMANGSVSGQGVVDGDYYDDGGKTVTKGTAYGWVSAQSYVDALEYTDKLMYAYDFGEESSAVFTDRYNSTYGVNNGAEWNSSAISANGVLTFDGNDYAILDRGILYTEDIEIQTALLAHKGMSDEQTLLHLGNDTDYIKLLASNSEGCVEAVFSCNGVTEKLTSGKAYDLGTWLKIRLILDGDTGKLVINDETVASGTVTINPNDVASAVAVSDETAVYRLGADEKLENSFSGRVDFIRIFSDETTAPTEVYTENEVITESKTTLLGDLDYNEIINVFDFVIMKRMLLSDDLAFDSRKTAACDLNSDGSLTAADVVLMQEYLLNIELSFEYGIYVEYFE